MVKDEGLVLAQRGCHHGNIVVAPRLAAADIPPLFQILPTALLLLADTNSCSFCRRTVRQQGRGSIEQNTIKQSEEQSTEKSPTATLSFTKVAFWPIETRLILMPKKTAVLVQDVIPNWEVVRKSHADRMRGFSFASLWILYLRDDRLDQTRWIFGKLPRGVGDHFWSKKFRCRF